MKVIWYRKLQHFPDEGDGGSPPFMRGEERLSAGNAKAALVLPDNSTLQIQSRRACLSLSNGDG
jgi:hypothetical protein